MLVCYTHICAHLTCCYNFKYIFALQAIRCNKSYNCHATSLHLHQHAYVCRFECKNSHAITLQNNFALPVASLLSLTAGKITFKTYFLIWFHFLIFSSSHKIKSSHIKIHIFVIQYIYMHICVVFTYVHTPTNKLCTHITFPLWLLIAHSLQLSFCFATSLSMCTYFSNAI